MEFQLFYFTNFLLADTLAAAGKVRIIAKHNNTYNSDGDIPTICPLLSQLSNMFSILRALHKVSVFSPKKHEESFPYLEMCEDERNKLPTGVKHAPREVLQESDQY
jgi:hypothetical protein